MSQSYPQNDLLLSDPYQIGTTIQILREDV